MSAKGDVWRCMTWFITRAYILLYRNVLWRDFADIVCKPECEYVERSTSSAQQGRRYPKRGLKYQNGFAVSFSYIRPAVRLFLRPSLAHCQSAFTHTWIFSHALHTLNMHRSPSFPLRSFTRCRYLRQASTRGTDHSNRITRISCFTENYTPSPLVCRVSSFPFILRLYRHVAPA